MNTNETNSRRTRQLVAFSMLAAGLVSAVVIYLTAVNCDESALIKEFEGSKKFVHDLELYGGKMNVIADRFARWFDELWYGESLAFTVAVLTVVLSAGYYLMASRLSAVRACDAADENSPGETG